METGGIVFLSTNYKPIFPQPCWCSAVRSACSMKRAREWRVINHLIDRRQMQHIGHAPVTPERCARVMWRIGEDNACSGTPSVQLHNTAINSATFIVRGDIVYRLGKDSLNSKYPVQCKGLSNDEEEL
ncbi:hypothetical protein BaRGS_00016675 [Batillaria attramentaria]|uniref:Uncharacterized protein n=1 Tax=Batillaria attramentaria TaxID=370345 RepID=A0ABD0KXK0_9CAEN